MPAQTRELIGTEEIYRQTDILPDGKEEDIITLRKFSDGGIDFHRYSGGSATRHVTGYYDNEAMIFLKPDAVARIGEDNLREWFSSGWIGARNKLSELQNAGEIQFSIMALNGS